MTNLSGPEWSVRDVLDALRQLERKMNTDDAPFIIKEAVKAGLARGVFGDDLALSMVSNGSKIDALEKLVYYIKQLAGDDFDTRHKLSQSRVKDWATSVDLPMSTTPSPASF